MAARRDKIMSKVLTSQNKPIVTDIDKLYTRYHDFNDHKDIFDYKNEYKNNYKFAGRVYNFENSEIMSNKTQNNQENDPMNRLAFPETNKSAGRRQLVNVAMDDQLVNCSSLQLDYLFCNEELPLSTNPEISFSDLLEDPFLQSDDDRDKDYDPIEDQSSSISDDKEETRKGKDCNIEAANQPLPHSDSYQHCEFGQCNSIAFSSCEKCFCLLCTEHYTCQVQSSSCEEHRPYSTENNAYNDFTKIVDDKENDFNFINLPDDSTELHTSQLDKNNNEDSKKNNKTKIKKKSLNKDNINSHISQCEYVECKEEVFSTCAKCLCFLCFAHFVHEDSCADCCKHSSSYLMDTRDFNDKEYTRNAYVNEINNKHSSEQDKMHTEDTVEYTKKGNLRKRRRIEEPLKERREKKTKMEIEKLTLKDPCSDTCRRKCTKNISDVRRKQINDEYVSLSWEKKGYFIKSLVSSNNVACRKTSSTESPKRNVSYAYHFYQDGKKIEVCKTYFLTTLGYNSKNDKRLMLALKRHINEQNCQRGKYNRTRNYDLEFVKEHIMKTYNPVNSHYRREHAPLRKYLPSDLTITLMHQEFCKNFPEQAMSFEVYRKIVRKDLNISFAHLGNEECEVCAQFEQSHKNHESENVDCEFCIKFPIHQSRYKESRKAYKSDVQEAEMETDTIYYSVDLQKVIMLPRMDQFKLALFCPRIIAFNDSFVPLGKSKKNNHPFAAVWNETVSGRKQEDIISTLNAFLLHKRDADNIVLWMDNCSSQNKNWAVLSYLVYIINSNHIKAKSITFKYFEPGHTFMSADSFHHQVEQALQRKKKVYDFADFTDAVQQSNSGKTYVKTMEVCDFYDYVSLSSQHKLRKMETRVYLKDIMVVTANRGEFTVNYKLQHKEIETQNLDFLQIKYCKTKTFPKFNQKISPGGILASRKNEIIKKLLELMPDNRKDFWLNLPVSDNIPAIE